MSNGQLNHAIAEATENVMERGTEEATTNEMLLVVTGYLISEIKDNQAEVLADLKEKTVILQVTGKKAVAGGLLIGGSAWGVVQTILGLV